MPAASRVRTILAVCSLFLFGSAVPPPLHASYEVQPLGFLEGWFGTVFDSSGLGLSDGGRAVGTSYSNLGGGTGRQAFLWSPAAGMTGLGDLAGGQLFSVAEAVNDQGEVAGWGYPAAGTQAWFWSAASGLVGLEGFSGSSAAYGINSAGQVIGKGASPQGQQAFLWSLSGGLLFLGDLPGGAFQSVAFAINDAGLVVGSGTSSLGVQAFAWDQAGGMRALEFAPGFDGCLATAVGDGTPATIAGYCYSATAAESYLWDAATGLISGSLGHLPEGSVKTYARGINDAGQVVGTATTASGEPRPFLFVPGAAAGLVELQEAITTPGWTITEAKAISNTGVIVGTGQDAGGISQALLLRPAACAPAAEICDDLIDNDCDGLADCEDDGCAQSIDCIACYGNDECSWPGSGKYCRKPDLDCAAAGRCVAPPPAGEVCAAVVVCGCDGGIYPTPCDAARHGATLAPAGVCCGDGDGDGFSPAGSLCGPADCDDASGAVHPGAAEICDGKDNDCDGLVDEVPARIELSQSQFFFAAVLAGPAPPAQILTVTNPGCGAFGWSAAADVPWLAIGPDAGGNGDAASIGVDAAALAAGVASATITVRDPANAGLAGAQATVSVTITTDAAAPAGAIQINGGASATASRAVTLHLAASDPGGSGLDAMRFANAGGAVSAWEPYRSTKAWTLSGGAGGKTVFAQFRDRAGNLSDADPLKAGAQSSRDGILFDPVAPTGTLAINGGAATTSSREVTLQLAAADAGGSGLDAMRLANGGGATGAWEPYQAARNWTLTPGAGSKAVFVQFRDAAGNVSDADPLKAGVQSYRAAIGYTGR